MYWLVDDDINVVLYHQERIIAYLAMEFGWRLPITKTIKTIAKIVFKKNITLGCFWAIEWNLKSEEPPSKQSV